MEQEEHENRSLHEQLTKQQEVLDSRDDDIQKRMKSLERGEKEYKLKVREVAERMRALELKENEVSVILAAKSTADTNTSSSILHPVDYSPLSPMQQVRNDEKENDLNVKAKGLEAQEENAKESLRMIEAKMKELEERELSLAQREGGMKISLPVHDTITPPTVLLGLRSPPMTPVHNAFTRKIAEYGFSSPMLEKEQLLEVNLKKHSADDRLGILIQMAKSTKCGEGISQDDKVAENNRFLYVAKMSDSATSLGRKSGLKIGDIIRYVDGFAPCANFSSIKEVTSYMKERTDLVLSIQRPEFCDQH